jgi:hypothetical protein
MAPVRLRSCRRLLLEHPRCFERRRHLSMDGKCERRSGRPQHSRELSPAISQTYGSPWHGPSCLPSYRQPCSIPCCLPERQYRPTYFRARSPPTRGFRFRGSVRSCYGALLVRHGVLAPSHRLVKAQSTSSDPLDYEKVLKRQYACQVLTPI